MESTNKRKTKLVLNQAGDDFDFEIVPLRDDLPFQLQGVSGVEYIKPDRDPLGGFTEPFELQPNNPKDEVEAAIAALNANILSSPDGKITDVSLIDRALNALEADIASEADEFATWSIPSMTFGQFSRHLAAAHQIYVDAKPNPRFCINLTELVVATSTLLKITTASQLTQLPSPYKLDVWCDGGQFVFFAVGKWYYYWSAKDGGHLVFRRYTRNPKLGEWSETARLLKLELTISEGVCPPNLKDIFKMLNL